MDRKRWLIERAKRRSGVKKEKDVMIKEKQMKYVPDADDNDDAKQLTSEMEENQTSKK